MTDMTKADATILKTDELGRVRTPAARRESLILEFERSGLSGIKFAALAGIKYSTFAAWLQRRRRQGGRSGNAPVKPADSVRWLEAVVDQAQDAGSQKSPGVVLELPCGARVQITDAKQAVLAAVLLRALEKPC